MKKLTAYVIHVKSRPLEWFEKCIASLLHPDIHIEVLEQVPSLEELFKLRFELPNRCTTPYMMYVDDDDWIDSSHITPMLNLLTPGYGGVYSNEYLVSETGNIIKSRIAKMTQYNLRHHCYNFLDVHHLTILNTFVARQATHHIPKNKILMDRFLYGVVGLLQPLRHYP